MTPPSATAGSEAFPLTVTGQNFFSGATVPWNGSRLPTSFENSTQVRAAISAADVANSGTAQVTVVNPPPGGGTSNALPFTICARGR